MEQTIDLKTCDDNTITIGMTIASQFGIIKLMIDDTIERGQLDDATDKKRRDPILLPKVTFNTLKKIISWCEYHKNDPVIKLIDDPEVPKEEALCNWDQQFFKAANYLDIKKLLDISCMHVANMIKGKTPEEIRKHFNIKNDLTEEEEERIRKENEWVENR